MNTKKNKINVVIFFGGRSCEHEVSLQSVQSVYKYLDTNKFDPILVGIDKEGNWYYYENLKKALINPGNPKTIGLKIEKQKRVIYDPKIKKLLFAEDKDKKIKYLNKVIDIVFPVLHGPYGEDGTIQGYMELFDVPIVGASLLGSAVAMDKDVAKRLLRQAGLQIPDFIVLNNKQWKDKKIDYKFVSKKLGKVFFVKPCNLGSSVGISKIDSEIKFKKYTNFAFKFDDKIIFEKAIFAREIECSVLGNEDPVCSLPGEIIPSHDFYSYDAKYIDEQGALLVVPVKLNSKIINKIQKLAIKAYETCAVSGMARVDFFLEKKTNKIYLNELNTIPGFTNISMYPKLWEASGLSYSKLLTKLIDLAIAKQKRRDVLNKAI
ncbi:MAG: D-alanine--D-alanine ligase family protein [Pseudomonadota bacterium]